MIRGHFSPFSRIEQLPALGKFTEILSAIRYIYFTSCIKSLAFINLAEALLERMTHSNHHREDEEIEVKVVLLGNSG